MSAKGGGYVFPDAFNPSGCPDRATDKFLRRVLHYTLEARAPNADATWMKNDPQRQRKRAVVRHLHGRARHRECRAIRRRAA
jgi:hypothetical protein